MTTRSPHSLTSGLTCATLKFFSKLDATRISVSCLIALLLLTLVACGGGATNSGPGSNPPPPAPTIASFNPTSGASGTAVIITGTNFTGATSVKFNGMASSFAVNTAAQITAMVPNGSTTGQVSVTTPGGTATSASSFTVNLGPTVSSFSPASGVVGASVVITGTNFTGATAVSFNGTAATFTVDSATQITAPVPSGATTGKISVTTPNGTGTSAANFSVLPPAPTISSFNPVSGLVGASVVITGTSFSGATAVAFNGKAASSFTVNSATQITATVASATTTGKVSVTTAGGTATSAANFTVIPSPPTISGFNPTTGPVGTAVVVAGTNFTGATAVSFNGTPASSFTVNSAAQITATVATGTTTGKIAVTTAGGTATSVASFTINNSATTLDLSIDGFYVTQATQNYPAPAVPLVKDRSAWVRVFVVANQTNSVAPQVRVRFINGATTNTLTINAPSTNVPTSVDITDTLHSWDAAVSSAWIQPGVQVIADVDPAGAIPEADETNNSSTSSLDVRTLKPWKVTLVAVHTTDGKTGAVVTGTRTSADWVDFAKRLHPVPDAIDVIVGATMNSSVASLASDGTGWGTVLNEVSAKRGLDGVTDRYYFGVVKVGYSSGVAGLGFIGAPAAIGWDYSSGPSVLAHEVGHNFNRPHSPCGGATGTDPNYPYPGGPIGVPGWDVFASSGNFKSATTYFDIMSYCNPQWVSDYVYKAVLSFRAASSFGSAQPGPGAIQGSEGLLVWGRIQDGHITLEPGFRVPMKGVAPVTGEYNWEGRDRFGIPLASVSFDAPEVADLPDHSLQLFSFIVPLSVQVLDSLNSQHVLHGGREVARQVRTTASDQVITADAPVDLIDLAPRRLQLTWNAARYPMLMLRDARTGEVRGFLRGGLAQAEQLPAEIEVHVSDGVRSQIIRHTGPVN